MNLRVQLLFAIAVICSMAVYAATDSPVQVRYFANVGPSPYSGAINVTNTGATGGSICVNVYAFSPDEQEISCCACPITPNGLVSLDVNADLLSNTLTPFVPGSIVVKLVATTPPSPCNAASLGALTPGMAAWATTVHLPPYAPVPSVTETAFTNATPSTSDLARASALCGFIQSNGSGFGICKSCRSGGLGGIKK
jgi:hypothetical protein